MSVLLASVLLFILASAVVETAYPFVLKSALNNHLVDIPDDRKLQKEPVAVAGGFAVFTGIAAGLLVGDIFFTIWKVSVLLTSMLILVIIGAVDDVKNLKPSVRVAVEVLVIYMFITGTELFISDFSGLWGIGAIPLWVAYPLSIIAGVGILNATNLIDGVDGLCSGFCIFACTVFAGLFFKLYSPRLGCIAVVCAASLLPFFIHNVFGRRSKMFLGDCGSLLLGLMLTIFIFSVFSHDSPALRLESHGVGTVAIVLAVMSVPVFDTLRVMFSRIYHHHSPFLPDKTHLHHDFIRFGFSHLATTVSIIVLDIIVLAAWRVTYVCGGSIDLQFYVVAATGILVTVVTHLTLKSIYNGDTAARACLMKAGKATMDAQESGVWKAIERIIDKRVK